MRRSEILYLSHHFDLYTNLVGDAGMHDAFEKSITQLFTIDKCKWKMIGNRTYAEGKWTIKEILQHIADMERILSYHVLLISRNDSYSINIFDKNIFVNNPIANNRSLADLIKEILTIRKSTYSLFKSFPENVLQSKPIKNAPEITLLTTGFNIIGHQLHHFQIIENLYFPLLKDPGQNYFFMNCNLN